MSCKCLSQVTQIIMNVRDNCHFEGAHHIGSSSRCDVIYRQDSVWQVTFCRDFADFASLTTVILKWNVLKETFWRCNVIYRQDSVSQVVMTLWTSQVWQMSFWSDTSYRNLFKVSCHIQDEVSQVIDMLWHANMTCERRNQLVSYFGGQDADSVNLLWWRICGFQSYA